MPHKDPAARKAYMREYSQKPECKERKLASSRKRRQDPRVRESERRYNRQKYATDTAYRTNQKRLQGAWVGTEVGKASIKASKSRFLAKPEAKAKVKAYQARPDVAMRAKASARRYHLRNPDKIAAINKRFAKANPDKIRQYARVNGAKRKAYKLNSVGAYTREDVAACLATQGHRCFYCLGSILSSYHVDHMTPLARGGSNGPENIVCACASCNLRKNKKTAAEFILGRAA